MDVSETIIPPSEDDFENAVELLQIMDVEELNGEVAISLEEVSYFISSQLFLQDWNR